jgi:hypothetical protein
VFLVSKGDSYFAPPLMIPFLAVYASAFVIGAYLDPGSLFT